MFRRTFEGNAPYLTFTRDWQQIQFGNFVPGRTVSINYDAGRLPEERSYYNGDPTWNITAFYQFSAGGPVRGNQLETPTGQVVARIADDPAEATFMTTSIDIPEDAQELIMWFMNTGQSGRQFWDSDYGANYIFRFTSLDIQGESATVVSDPQTPYGGFQVSMTALPEVENVVVNFNVINNPPDNPFAGNVPLLAGALENGRRSWAVAGVAVPRGANIRFNFTYTVGGRTFTDDNDGAGFYAPKPLPTHDPRKYAEAVRAAAG
ncbi:MAG: hypothetical protein QOJ98_698 [Acidobacteriota bacterium]|jgi:hypothetical protein|nr:hypothetical protein [Acidobacteriota bacterium]